MTRSVGGREFLRGLTLLAAVATGYVFGASGDRATAQQGLPGTPPAPLPPGMAPQPAAAPVAQPAGVPAQPKDRRVVAYITDPAANTLVEITREELGEFLIARGEHEKLQMLVNRRIIENEAARRGVSVTLVEIKAGLEDDLRGLGINLKDFETGVLKRYNKNLYEWVEDVIRPRILLTKMCQDRVKVSEPELKRAYDNKYGERRQARVLCWNKGDDRLARNQWNDARKSDDDFVRIAKMQAEPALASVGGLVDPIGRYPDAKDRIVVETLFRLKEGEMSEIFATEQGLMCLKLVKIFPPDTTVQFDEKTRAVLTSEMSAKRLEQEIGAFFQEIKKAAQPNLLLKGPPSAEEFREGVTGIINNANLTPAGGLPPRPAGGAVRP